MRQTLRSVTAILVFMNIAVMASAQSNASKISVGGPAPGLAFEKLLQAPKETRTDWKSLEGRVVVLEFWATWCAPCIAAIPHLNELANKLGDKGVQFIAITDDNESLAGRFLRRKTMKAWVGLDSDRSVSEAYGANALPYTVVVSGDGKIVAITSPKRLTEQMINDVLERKPVSVTTERSDVPSAPVSKQPLADEAPARFALTIKPTEAVSLSMSRNRGKFQAKAASLNMIFGFLFNVSKTRIIGPPSLEDPRYAISASMPDGDNDQFQPILIQAIEASLKLKVRRETREMEVFVLSAPDSNAVTLTPNAAAVGHASDDDGVLAASAVPLSALAKALEVLLKRPVVDETSLKGQYNWTLLFDEKNPESIIDEIRKELGLELKRASRQVEVLVVTTEGSEAKKN
jgi:uncharacterized protein (TIGR03435 family)